MEKIGIGMIGYGFIGRIHALAFSSLPYYYGELPALPEILGICTSSPQSAQKAGEEIGVDFVTHRLDELLAREDIQIVVVATPNIHHREAVEKAVEKGKAVYCDKPLAMNLAEAKAVAETVDRSGIPFGMAFQYRFIPALMRARELIEVGKVGEIFRARVAYLHSGYIDPARPMKWRLRREMAGGGALADLGSHVVDLVHFLVGDTQVTSARTRTFIDERPVEASSSKREKVLVDDWCEVAFHLSGGAEGTIEASRFATGSCDEIRLEIEGSKGSIRFNSMQPNYLEFYDNFLPKGSYGGQRGFQHIEAVQQYPPPNLFPGKNAIGWVRYHIACAHDFLMRYGGKACLGAGTADGVRVQRFLEDAYRLSGYAT